MLTALLRRWLARVDPPADPPPGRIEGKDLIHRVDLTIDASCPCGSQLIHHLTLMTTADCPRCGRTMAIRSIVYHRTSPAAVPVPVISVGYVHTDHMLRASRTKGVH